MRLQTSERGDRGAQAWSRLPQVRPDHLGRRRQRPARQWTDRRLLPYEESAAILTRIQRHRATIAANRIEQYVREIEHQLGWANLPLWASEPASQDQRLADYQRLLQQVPAITELTYIDHEGREQLHVSRISLNRIGQAADRSAEASFLVPAGGKTYFSPVSFRNGSEPYLTIAMPSGGRTPGINVAEVNVKFVQDVIADVRPDVGPSAYAYVVDATGVLIAHPDEQLVLRMTDLSRRPQVGRLLATPQGTADEDAWSQRTCKATPC